ncbi:MAG: A/G-specific adenine glycosylase [Fibrobacteria bacterium]|nr:A/G-specific adenine glycosylase [Fibrobacteria bacterium]
MLTSKAKLLFQKKVLNWYKKNKRDLPWRKTRNPYTVLVSEIMLQQTQVDRVIGYYLKFIDRFPDTLTLSRARKRTLLSYWSGLGYNNRALNLQKLAQIVCKENNGIIPRNEQSLLKLPGIGPYTAHAVLAFAFNKPVPVLDTNIRRVLIYEFSLDEKTPLEELKALALDCIPEKKSRIWHNALMDYGSMVVTARKTGIAPLSKQGTFEGSDRWVRGNLVKLLLKSKRISVNSLTTQFDENQLRHVINKMLKEKLFILKNEYLSLS